MKAVITMLALALGALGLTAGCEESTKVEAKEAAHEVNEATKAAVDDAADATREAAKDTQRALEDATD